MTLVEELKILLKDLAPSFTETELSTFIAEALLELRLSEPTYETRNLILDIGYRQALKTMLANFDRYFRFSHEGGSVDRIGTYENLLSLYEKITSEIEKRKPAALKTIKL
ncbi:MAG: hypothetical protein ACPL6C_02085 [bacterium]